MSEFHEVPCSAEQFGLLQRNVWRYASIQGKQVRIRDPQQPSVSALPPGSTPPIAIIEILDEAVIDGEMADEEAVRAVEQLFAHQLSD